MTLFRRIGPVPLIFVGFWILLMIGGRTKLLRDPGTLWHTTVGEKVLQDGFFEDDPFSFTRFGARWVPHQWLGEVAMALVHRIGGFDALLAFAAAVLAALFTWLTVRLLRTGLHPVPVLLIVLMAFAAGALQFHVRPLLFTMVGTAVVMVTLVGIESDRIPLPRVLWLVPFFVIWTNVHGGALGGLAMLVAAGAGWSIARVVGWPSPLGGSNRSGAFLALIAACGFTVIANPYGTEIPRAWLGIMRGAKISGLIEEHKRLDPSELASWALFAFAAVYFLVLAGLKERPRISWLLPILWFVQAILRVRHGPLFAISALVVIAEVWPRTRWAEWLAQRRPDLQSPAFALFPTPLGAWLIPLALLIGVWTTQSCGIAAPIVGAGWAKFDRTRWPFDLLPVLREHEPAPGEPNRLFNSCNFGGFAIHLIPAYKVFIDDRVELYGEEYYEDFVASDRPGLAATAIHRWQSQYGDFAFALVEPEGAYSQALRDDPDWQLVAECEAAKFFRRR